MIHSLIHRVRCWITPCQNRGDNEHASTKDIDEAMDRVSRRMDNLISRQRNIVETTITPPRRRGRSTR